MIKVKVYIDGKHDYIYYIDEFETIEKIIKDKCSICRFGDGEFKLAVGNDQKCCQMKDKKLQKRLCEILKSTHKNILVGLPNIYYNFKNKPPFPGYEWKTYRSKKYIQLLKGNNTYYSTPKIDS